MKINDVFVEKHVAFSTDEGDFNVDQWGNVTRWTDHEESGQGYFKWFIDDKYDPKDLEVMRQIAREKLA